MAEPTSIVAPAGKELVRTAGECPICAGVAAPLDRYRFGKKEGLPDAVQICHCTGCDFLFVAGVGADAYRRHYARFRNDGGHVVDSDQPDVDVQLQADQIVSRLPTDFAGTILDFGCGLGRLLTVLRRRLPRARLFGHDVANWMPSDGGVTFVRSLQQDETRYDVVIMAHVLEHLVTFDALRAVVDVLSPNGLCYLEVPDPVRYATHPRREFMYYVDRLHVNHFSRLALRRLLAGYGLSCGSFGTHAFRYRDGLYPALYGVAARVPAAIRGVAPDHHSRDAPETRCERPSLDLVYRAYRTAQEHDAGEVVRSIRAAGGDTGVVVYGAGDNFWRSRMPGGPLHGLRALAVVDRQAVELPADAGPLFETAADALLRWPNVPVVVTASQGASEICAQLRASWPDRAIFVV